MDAAASPALAPGMMVANKYELVRKIGAGAMGEVWAARHKSLDEEVAIKLMIRRADESDGISGESRFLLEARVAAQLSRKTRHIVAVTDHGQDGPLGYLVMELLAGESLDLRIARTGPMPLARIAPMITQIARGLSIAHAEGVVHRDLKPGNVFVTIDEEGKAVAKVLDFGIAKLRRTLGSKSAHTTQRGFLMGTPAYMSPEQARGKPLDHRADVWALAVIAYHMITGEFPFDGDSAEDLFTKLCRIEPTPIRQLMPDLPPIVEDFFSRAFARRIEDRFQSALSLAGAFEQLEPLAAGAVVSLPPPPALAIIDEDFSTVGLADRDRTLLEESLFVAGVPRRKKLVPLLIAAALLCAVLASTVAVLGVYFEREPARVASAGSTGVTTPDPHASARAIPPPEAPSAPTVISTDDLPTAAPRAIRPPPVVGPPSSPSIAAPPPPPPPEPAALPVVAAPPPPRTARSVDKSEVF